MLEEISEQAQALAAAGQRCVVVVGGDLNAVREEFVLGNAPPFFDHAAVQAVRPKLELPPVAADISPPPRPAVARVAAEDGTLRFLCPGVDGGELREGSSSTRDGYGAAACTRAGYTMWIDFVMVGAVGAPALRATATPHAVATAAESAACADSGDGVYQAVTRFGSDHLPVSCDISTAGA